MHTLVLLNMGAHILYLATVLFKFVLILYSLKRIKLKNDTNNTNIIWPSYTILLPCYKEGKVIKKLINSINNLDYPKEKLRVFLIVEDNDDETLNAIKKCVIPDHFCVLKLKTPLIPKGKPEACNQALKYVNSDYLVIFDAEDVPEKDQLKKAIMRLKP